MVRKMSYNLKQLIKQKRSEQEIKKLTRIKIGKILFVIAAAPLCSAWLFPIAFIMMMPMSFSMWVKDKIRYFNEWRELR